MSWVWSKICLFCSLHQLSNIYFYNLFINPQNKVPFTIASPYTTIFANLRFQNLIVCPQQFQLQFLLNSVLLSYFQKYQSSQLCQFINLFSMLRQFKHLSEFYPKHQRIIDASDHRMPHLTYPKSQAENLQVQHFKPEKFADWTALFTVKTIKFIVNTISGYNMSSMTQRKWLTRTLLLETLSVVPGMIGSMCRHMRSLRLFKKDNGWIQQLLEESDTQRFHYFAILSLRKPGLIGRMSLGLMQMIFAGQVLFGYILSSRHAHKFVGYLEEEAFKHYTEMLKEIDRHGSPLSHWKSAPASRQVIDYYKLGDNATLRDMILMIRADEMVHAEINHFLGEANKNLDINAEKQKMYGKDKDIVAQKIDQRQQDKATEKAAQKM